MNVLDSTRWVETIAQEILYSTLQSGAGRLRQSTKNADKIQYRFYDWVIRTEPIKHCGTRAETFHDNLTLPNSTEKVYFGSVRLS